MNLNIETVNFQSFEALENLINGLAIKRFGKMKFISSIKVFIKKQTDPRVPWKAEIELKPIHGASLYAESESSHYLTAFSQSVNRVQRQLDKYKGKHFENRA
jgi:ribosome-associated translation inhibitor RaiA